MNGNIIQRAIVSYLTEIGYDEDEAEEHCGEIMDRMICEGLEID